MFRYPGGKVRMTKKVLHFYISRIGADKFLDENELRQDKRYGVVDVKKKNIFVEPFTGGGATAEYMAKNFGGLQLHLNDLDRNMYAFWRIASGVDEKEINEFQKLVNRPFTMDLYWENKKNLEGNPDISYPMLAYHAIFFNRVNFNGVLRDAGLKIGINPSKERMAMMTRMYNPSFIMNEFIKLRNNLHGRTKVTNLSAMDLINQYDEDVAMYLDPPYYVVGDALYKTHMSHEEHVNLANILEKRKNWLLSYNDCEFIKTTYNKFAKIDEELWVYSSTNAPGQEPKKKIELIIYKDINGEN
jgi:DNA adenine methylase